MSKKKVDILQKRVPKNPKYENIESSIDTGASVSRYMRKIEEIKQNYRIRKDELFKRMKVTTFVQLLLQVAEINGHLYCRNYPETINENEEMINDIASEADTTATNETQRSTFQSVINGVGELDIQDNQTRDYDYDPQLPTNNGRGDEENVIALMNWEDMPYLLLDVRDRDDYNQCHIIKSMSYPSAMICRSVNFETKEMLACRNKPGKIIIVYDEDERLGPRVADTLVQRGYDNLFLLSGGLRMAYKKFPQGLITGKIPQAVLEFVKVPSNKKAISDKSQRSKSVTSTMSSVDNTNNNINSAHTKLEPEIKSEFTMEDLAHLSLQLDSVIDDQSSTASSIYSQSIKGSKSRMSLTSNSSSQVDHKRAFRC